MITIRSLLVTLVIFLNTHGLNAQNSPDQIINKFFEIYKIEGSGKAVDYIFSMNKYYSNILESIEQLKQNLAKTISMEGKYYDYELITKKKAGQSLTMMTFLVKYDKEPLTFKVFFYKASNTWQLQNFKFDNKIDEELEEASRAYRFRENLIEN